MRFLVILVSLLFALNSQAHEDHTKQQKVNMAISVAIDTAGNLWRVQVKEDIVLGDKVLVDKSSDMGKTFSPPVQVNQTAQKISNDGEARPKIAVSDDGYIYLTWTEALKTPFAGYIWFSRSINGGKSFEKPFIVHQDKAETTHRFDALNVAKNGKITITWVDKRDLIAAKAAGKKYDGAAIYYAVSEDIGISFKAEQKLADNSCECCRIANTNKPDGTVVALWRHVFEGGERDHMIAEIPLNAAKSMPHRATFGHWKIDGCPHHGAAIASGGEGKRWFGYHIAFFDGNDADPKNGPGLYYSRLDGEAWASSPAKKFGDNNNQAGHPAIISNNENVWLVWREIVDAKPSIVGMYSDDGGRSWSEAKRLASSEQKADYPILVSNKTNVYLVWNTQQNGLQVIALKPTIY